MDENLKFVLIFVVTFGALLVVLTKILSSKSSARKKALFGANQDLGSDFDEETLAGAAGTENPYEKIPFLGAIDAKLKKGNIGLSLPIFLIVALLIVVAGTMFLGKLLANNQLGTIISCIATYVVLSGYLRYKIEKRSDAFLENFPDALDMIVRSIRTGQPILSALRMIADNGDNDVALEFQKIVDEVSYGSPLSESLYRMSERVELLDINFFVVILSVQQETGGNLSEILSNLSGIIRKRRQLRQKIGAMTAEGRFTSWIFAAIPVVQLIAVSMMADGYVDPLFKTSQGNILLGIATGFIIFSVYMSKRMCRIEI